MHVHTYTYTHTHRYRYEDRERDGLYLCSQYPGCKNLIREKACGTVLFREISLLKSAVLPYFKIPEVFK